MNLGHILRTMNTAIWFDERPLLNSVSGGREEDKEEKQLKCPAVVIGSIAKEGNSGFHTFRYKLTSTSV